MNAIALKPASRTRIVLALCCVVFAGAGYRVLVAATRSTSPVAAIAGVHRDSAHASAARAAAHAAPATPASRPAPPVAAPTPLERLAALRAPVSVEAAHDPFTASSWLPPPPVVPPPPETRPAPPTAPPMPFTFVGEQDAKAARPRVFLSNGDQLLIVSPGDVIDRQYRVESVSESSVVLTYLPLNQVQVVSIPVEGK
ncbi:hypothetical protein BCO71033_03586 [Burkholderia contaminans]|uniref:Proline rich protein n=1 Tax=Burkholderia contaminans TaxID=488447 RepID=A0A6P2YX98_9BURK|nr:MULTISPECIES: hypothetical protein [Burkholderia]OXJ37988.1 hypothetical protein CFB82_06505 [Burkholderia sp. HI2714]VWD26880.1 hypothetical protein BCO71033_03586 [Burkholderia contaminans]